jgi:hypothetical protein
MFARPVDAAATQEADIMGAERIEPFMWRVSRRSVVGAGAKLAYASPLVAASFTLSPAFGYEQAAAYFEKKKRAKKPAPKLEPHPSSEAKQNADPTGDSCGDPTTSVAKPEADGEGGATGGRNAGHNKKGTKKGNREKNGRGNENNGGSSRSLAGAGGDCDDPQSGGSKGDGKPKGKGNSGGGIEPGGQDGLGNGGDPDSGSNQDSGAGNAGKPNQGKRSRRNQRGRQDDSVAGGDPGSPGSDPGADPIGDDGNAGGNTGNEAQTGSGQDSPSSPGDAPNDVDESGDPGSGDQASSEQPDRDQAGDGQGDGQGGTADETGGDNIAGGQGRTDPIPPPRDDSLYLPTNGGDGQVIDGPTPTDAGGSEAGETGDDPKFSVAKVVICHAVCTKKDPHRPLAYRLIELADDPDSWDRHASQDHGQGMCAKDEDIILGPANRGYMVKDCPGNRLSGP